jgi:hypothetical protein
MTNHPVELAPPILELRQYLLHRGRRDELIELFDREFVETQEALGIRVIGQFRDVDRVNHFVWLRGFTDHEGRRDALASFYSGPTWQEHGAAAAATMIDSGDVHQLKATGEPEQRLALRSASHRDFDANRGSIVVIVAHRRSDGEIDYDGLMHQHVIPTVEAAGFRTLGVYQTDPAENLFPALPVRPSNVVVWIGGGSGDDALENAARQVTLARDELARRASASGVAEVLLDVLRLEPTCRSCLNGIDGPQ